MTAIAPEKAPAENSAANPAPAKKGGAAKILALLIVLGAVAAAYYFFFMKPAAAEEEPVKGEVITLESVQVNLAEGHYLKVGVALQMEEGAEETEGAEAIDAIIDTFSGARMEDVLKPGGREDAREVLLTKISEVYEGHVLDVFYTDYVAQ